MTEGSWNKKIFTSFTCAIFPAWSIPSSIMQAKKTSKNFSVKKNQHKHMLYKKSKTATFQNNKEHFGRSWLFWHKKEKEQG